MQCSIDRELKDFCNLNSDYSHLLEGITLPTLLELVNGGLGLNQGGAEEDSQEQHEVQADIHFRKTVQDKLVTNYQNGMGFKRFSVSPSG